MKLRAYLIFLLLILPVSAGAWSICNAGGSLTLPVTTYFGDCDSSGNPSGTTGNDDTAIVFWHTFTCPGTGNQTVQELSAYVSIYDGTPSIRLAIYDSAGTTLIAQGTSAVTLVGTTDSWQGHMTQSSLSVNPLILSGGTDYIIALSGVGTGHLKTSHADETRSNGNYQFNDYSGGYPASLPLPGTSYVMYPVRVKVSQ